LGGRVLACRLGGRGKLRTDLLRLARDFVVKVGGERFEGPPQLLVIGHAFVSRLRGARLGTRQLYNLNVQKGLTARARVPYNGRVSQRAHVAVYLIYMGATRLRRG